MTGIYVRINRDGKWTNEEIEHLSDKEREDFFKRFPDKTMTFMNALCAIISNIETLDKILEETNKQTETKEGE